MNIIYVSASHRHGGLCRYTSSFKGLHGILLGGGTKCIYTNTVKDV